MIEAQIDIIHNPDRPEERSYWAQATVNDRRFYEFGDTETEAINKLRHSIAVRLGMPRLEGYPKTIVLDQ